MNPEVAQTVSGLTMNLFCRMFGKQREDSCRYVWENVGLLMKYATRQITFVTDGGMEQNSGHGQGGKKSLWVNSSKSATYSLLHSNNNRVHSNVLCGGEQDCV